MSEINFVTVDPETIINQMKSDYETETGDTLYPGDEHTMFLLNLGSVVTALFGKINDTGRQGLLKYARGAVLDAIGEAEEVPRLQPSKATVKQRFNFTVGHLGSIIPVGTKVSPDGTLFFETLETITVPAGTNYIETIVQAVETGAAYNGFTTGQINILIDTNIAYCTSVSNNETSGGGADLEEDGSTDYPYTAYRGRIRLSRAAKSTAGPYSGYEYLAKSANANIGDVHVESPAPCYITITALMDDGTVPNSTVLEQIETKVNDRTARPMGDRVTVQGPTLVDYAIEFSYKIRKEDLLKAAEIQAAVESAVNDYAVWQRQKLGQLINPDELRRRVLDAGAYILTITSPVLTELQGDEAARLSGTLDITYEGTI